MEGVNAKHVLEVPTAQDQEPVEAFAAESADRALGVRPRLRRSDRCLDHVDAVGAEDLVELVRELAVPIANQEPRLDTVVVELHQ